MKVLFLLLLAFCCTTSEAQNLLLNPTFADHTGCPFKNSQINLCNNWLNGSQGSSDFFHACATDTVMDVPQNDCGYQASNSNAYAGILTFCGQPINANYREYLYTEFTPLTIGAYYKVTIVVSLADSSLFATDGFGVFFSTESNYFHHYYNISNTPQIDYTSYGMIADKAGWVTLSKVFIADSGYKSLCIGNFRADAATNVTISSYSGKTVGVDSTAYYYVDSVSVEEVPASAVANLTSYKTAPGLFPNPFTHDATITFENDVRKEYSLHLYDVQGKLVRRIDNIRGDKVNIERGNLNSGFYTYKIYEGAEPAGSGRFIIKN